MLGLVGGALASPLPRPCPVPRAGGSARGSHSGSATCLRGITKRAHCPVRGRTSPASGSPFFLAYGVAFASFPCHSTTPVLRERVHSSVLLHWSRFYTPPDAARSREGCPRRATPITECSEHPSGRRRHWCGGAGAPGVVREHARGTRRRRGRCSAAGSTGGSAVESEVDYGSRLLHVGSACRAASAQRAPGRRTRRVGR